MLWNVSWKNEGRDLAVRICRVMGLQVLTHPYGVKRWKDRGIIQMNSHCGGDGDPIEGRVWG